MNKFVCFLAALLFATTAVAKTRVITLTSANTILLRDEVTEDSVSKLSLQLEAAQGKSVYLYIYSPGGSVIAGMKLINLINALSKSGTDITCIADYAASMAFSILQACPKRLILENGILMQHQAYFSIEGQVTNNRSMFKFLEDLTLRINQLDAARLQMPVAEFQAKIAHDWWLYDSQAIDAKAADERVLVHCDAALAKSTYVEAVQSLFGSAIIKWSSCPIIYSPLSINIRRSYDAKTQEFNDWVNSLPIAKTWKERMEVRR